MEPEQEVQANVDMVQWADGTHEIYIYNDNNGYGLTACEERIGPWDVWLVGEITCVKCKRLRTEGKHKKKGPREWFPKKPEEKKPKGLKVSGDSGKDTGKMGAGEVNQ